MCLTLACQSPVVWTDEQVRVGWLWGPTCLGVQGFGERVMRSLTQQVVCHILAASLLSPYLCPVRHPCVLRTSTVCAPLWLRLPPPPTLLPLEPPHRPPQLRPQQLRPRQQLPPRPPATPWGRPPPPVAARTQPAMHALALAAAPEAATQAFCGRPLRPEQENNLLPSPQLLCKLARTAPLPAMLRCPCLMFGGL